MKKYGFTTIELLSVIVILAIIMGIAVVGLNYLLNKGNESFYKNIEQDLLLSGSEYFNNNRNEKPIDGVNEVSLKKLVDAGYIDKIVDKDGNPCNDGKVLIFEEDDQYKYEACLNECGGYTTETDNCKYEYDDDAPTCSISISREWIIIGKSDVNYNIVCNDNKHFFDSSISTSNISLSSNVVSLGTPVKSNNGDLSYKYSGTVTGKSVGETSFTLKEGAVSDGGKNTNSSVKAGETLKVYKEATEGTISSGLIYNGNDQVLISGGNNVTYSITTGKDAKTYTIVIKANDDSLFADGKKEHKVTVTISKKILTIPSQSGSLTYNSETQSPSWNNYDSSLMTIGGTTSGTNAGDYTVKFVLKNKNNYTWSDNTNDKDVVWKIAKASCTCSITNIPEIKYPGNSVDVTYSCGGDGTVSISSNNESIIKVIDGKLEPKKVGNNVTITVSRNAGANYNKCSNGTKTIDVTNSTYNISYTLNEGTNYSGAPANYTYGTGAKINGTPSRNDFKFNGWCTASNLTGCAFTQTISKTDSGDKTYYAKWCQNCANVSNGSCSLDASTSGVCTYTTSCNTGYTLTAGSGTYNPTCTVNSYTLTYDANGGSVDSTSKSINYGAQYGTLPNATRSGYTLAGWFTAASGGTQVTATTTMGLGDVIIYAHWSQNSGGGGGNTNCGQDCVDKTMYRWYVKNASGEIVHYSLYSFNTSNEALSECQKAYSSCKTDSKVLYMCKFYKYTHVNPINSQTISSSYSFVSPIAAINNCNSITSYTQCISNCGMYQYKETAK